MTAGLASQDFPEVVIPAGTDFSAAIAQMLFNAMSSDADYSIDFPAAGCRTPELRYAKDSDFLRIAHDLAQSIGKRLVRIPHERYKNGMYRLIENNPLDRELMLEFAYQMCIWDVDAFFSQMTTVQWDEWRTFLQKRHR